MGTEGMAGTAQVLFSHARPSPSCCTHAGGAPDFDAMTIHELREYLKDHHVDMTVSACCASTSALCERCRCAPRLCLPCGRLQTLCTSSLPQGAIEKGDLVELAKGMPLH